MDGEDGQGGGHVLVLHQDPGGNIQMGGGKIPDGLDAAGNQLVGYLLGRFCRDGDDAHQHLVGAAILGQSGNGKDRLALVGLLHLGAAVKGCHDVQAVFIKALISHQCLAQLTGTDEDGIGGVVIAQELLDIVNQGLPEVADLGTAAVGNHGKVFADLHLAHSQGIGQGGCGNMGRRCIGHTLQIGKIPGQTLQNRFGDLLRFHTLPLFYILRNIHIDIFSYRLYHTDNNKVKRMRSVE